MVVLEPSPDVPRQGAPETENGHELRIADVEMTIPQELIIQPLVEDIEYASRLGRKPDCVCAHNGHIGRRYFMRMVRTRYQLALDMNG